jgi:hypothetical protein
MDDSYLPVVLQLKNVIERSNITSQGLILSFKRGILPKTMVVTKVAGIGGVEWIFVSPCIVYQQNEMADDERKQLYKKLKSMECKIKSMGFLKKSYRFVVNENLKKLFPNLDIDNSLAEYLNTCEDCLSLIKFLDELSIGTYFEISDSQDVLTSSISFYENPQKIGWIIYGLKAFDPISEIFLYRTVSAVFELYGKLHKRLEEFTKSYYEENFK